MDLRRKTSSWRDQLMFFFSFGMLPSRSSTAFFPRSPWQTHTGPSGVVSPEVGGTAIFPVFFFCIMSDGWGPRYNFCQFFSLRLGRLPLNLDFGIVFFLNTGRPTFKYGRFGETQRVPRKIPLDPSNPWKP